MTPTFEILTNEKLMKMRSISNQTTFFSPKSTMLNPMRLSDFFGLIVQNISVLILRATIKGLLVSTFTKNRQNMVTKRGAYLLN